MFTFAPKGTQTEKKKKNHEKLKDEGSHASSSKQTYSIFPLQNCIKSNFPKQEWNEPAKLNNFPEDYSLSKDKSRKPNQSIVSL